MEIMIIKRIKRFFHKKRVAQIFSDLFWNLDREYMNTARAIRKYLYPYYSQEWVDYNFEHGYHTLKNAFYQLGIWNAW